MDFKQELVDDIGSESIDIKEEPLTAFQIETNRCEINQKNNFVQKAEVENTNRIHSQIDQTTTVDGCLYFKNDSESNTPHSCNQKLPGIELEIPKVNDSQFQPKEFCIGNSELVKIKQEIDAKYELLTEECDLPLVKTEADFLNKSCGSQQLLLKNNTRKRLRSCTSPVCQKDGSCGEKLKKARRNSTTFSTAQLTTLEKVSEKTNYPDAFVREDSSANVSLSEARIQMDIE